MNKEKNIKCDIDYRLRFIKGVLQATAVIFSERGADGDELYNWQNVCNEADDKLEEIINLVDQLEEKEARS